VPECWLTTGEEASVVIGRLNDYDQEAWAELEKWRTARLTAKERHLLPKGARKLATGVREVVRRANWATLNQHGVTKVVRMVYERLGLTLTKRKLGQAIPAVGVVVGAGLNARLLDRLTTDADRRYRERFLRE
jgi:hypothetical protein